MTRFVSKYITIIFMIFASVSGLSAVDSKSLFEQGMEAFKSGNYGSSELLFRKITDEEDDYLDRAWYHLALSIYNQKEYKSAIFEFNRFLTTCATPELCSLSRYWIAESNYYLKDYSAAIEEYKRFISDSKDDMYIALAYDRIGRIYFTQRRYEESVIEWTKAISRDKDVVRNNRRRLNVGEAQFYNEKHDEALDLLKTLLSPGIDPKVSAKARMIMGMIYQLKGKDWPALNILKGIPDSLLVEDPFYNVQYYRAMSYIALDNQASAKEYLESFLLIGQSSDLLYDAKYELGRILIKERKEGEAVKHLDDVRTRASRPELKSRAAMILGKLNIEKQDYHNSVTYLEEAAVSEKPEEKKEAMLLLAGAYMQIKRFAEAEKVLGKLKEEYPYDSDNDYVQFLLGRLYLEKGDIEKAVDGFSKVRDINPFSKYLDESYYFLGLAYMKNEKNEKAVEMFNQYLGCKNPENVYDTYRHLLDIFVDMKNYRKAENTINTMIKYYLNKPGIEEVLYWYGRALKSGGMSEQKYFNIILSSFPSSEAAGKVLIQWGDEAFAGNNFKKAERYYRNYLGVPGRQNEPSVFLYRIICLYKMERYNEVIAILKGETPPVDDFTSKQLTLWLGRAYYRTGDCEQTYNTMYKWKLSDYIADDLVIISKCAIKIGDVITVQDASKLLAGDKKLYAGSLYDLGMFFSQKDELDTALGYFSRILEECPASEFEDGARTEMSRILIKKERYEEAISRLKDIKAPALQDRKNAMLIISYFGSGDDKSGAALSEKSYDRLFKDPLGEKVMSLNLKYYYTNKSLKDFDKYAWGLEQYRGNSAYVNYLSGKLNFELGNYRNAYNRFSKIANAQSEYLHEALFCLGLISAAIDGNTKRALWYFKRLADDRDTKSEYSLKGRLALAVIAQEKGDTLLSTMLLQEIIGGSGGDRLLKIQAENLFDYYGYAEKINQ